MNKPTKAKNLPLFSIIDLDQLRRENHLEGTEVTDFFTARDGKVYLLMEQPSETQGMMIDSIFAEIRAYRHYYKNAVSFSCLLYTSPPDMQYLSQEQNYL